MKLKEEQLHLLFKIGVALKGLDGVVETISGIVLCFVSTTSLRNVVDRLTEGELEEDPGDFIANHLVHFFHNLSVNTKHFAIIFLLIHGVIKIGLVIGLLRGKLRAYPIALVILSLFLCFQVYRLTQRYSLGLTFISIVDVIIVFVIWRDYQYLKKRKGRIHSTSPHS